MKICSSESNRRRLSGVLAILSFTLATLATLARAQQQASPQLPMAATGSVMGHAVDEVTKLPLRFAEIRLVPLSIDGDLSGVGDQTPTNPPKPHIQEVLAHSGFDGSFRVDGVPAGNYFAGAIFPGYVEPGASDDAKVTGNPLARLIASIATVHVAAGQTAIVNLTLRRGGVISGRVTFADGSPAIGAAVEWQLSENNPAKESVRMARPSPSQQIMQTFEYYTQRAHQAVTDDEGRYRIFGLSPGNYIVSTIVVSQISSMAQVILSDGSSPSSGRLPSLYPEMTTVYGPGVFRRSDARVFEIRGNEEVVNADLKVDPRGLHTVRGKVRAGEDGHVPSQAALLLREDGGKEVGKFVEVEEDGSFQFDYLLPGRYTLELMGATDEARVTGTTDLPEVLRRYKASKVPVVVGNHDLVLDDVLLTVLKPGEKEEDPR